MPITRHLPAVALIATLVAGCGGQTPSASVASSPPGTSVPSPTPSIGVPPAPTASPEPVLQPIPVPTVLPAGPAFDVSWTELTGREVPSLNGSMSEPLAWEAPTAVRWGNGAVVVYPGEPSGSDPGPMIWWSPDLVTWSRAVQPQASGSGVVWARFVVVGGPGLAVLGGNVNESGDVDLPRLWTTHDGANWQVGIPPKDATFIWGRPGRIVVFGRSTWVSDDGRTWTETGPSPFATAEFLQQARATIIDDGDGAIVLARTGFDAPTTVHRLGSDGTWEDRGLLEGFVRSAVRGPTGIVALGYTLGDTPVDAAWRSADGRAWEMRKGMAPAGRLVAAATGYVVVGARSYFEGCAGFDPSAQVVNTWTSPDGFAWQLMDEDGAQDHVDLPVVLPDGDRLIAFGLRWAPDTGGALEDRATPSVWATGPLVPPTAPGPKQTASGCT
jgi:hypothetical protein